MGRVESSNPQVGKQGFAEGKRPSSASRGLVCPLLRFPAGSQSANASEKADALPPAESQSQPGKLGTKAGTIEHGCNKDRFPRGHCLSVCLSLLLAWEIAGMELFFERRWQTMLGLGIIVGVTVAGAKGEVFSFTEKPAGPRVEKWSGSHFLRVTRDNQGTPIALETAIVRFEGHYRPGGRESGPPAAVKVDLVAAVHLADPAYFRELNRRFQGYDAVLYELVAPPDARPSPDAPAGFTWWGFAQQLATQILGLQFQLDGIDYQARNFVHADMTPEQFRESMTQRRESAWQILLRILAQAMLQPKPIGDEWEGLWEALQKRGRQRELALRRWAATHFEDLELAIQAVEGPRGSTILSERNKVALRVLRDELQKNRRSVAIFYGAAHMPDFARRLQEEFSLQPTQWTWLVAWDLKE